ncbi:MAG: CDP-alcohol phosphatidyltransferase family protein [Verrucomicrobia bacterium]|nr:CDP-alcohol phosphatidyltransferase family protein [Verrucomicrobiota bacterium]
MSRRSHVPNLLSATRIVLMPAVLLTAMGGLKAWFIGLLIAGLLTDALDGYLARRFKAQSELGRKLDSFADYLTMITGIAGIALLWPAIMQRELVWVTVGLVAFFAVVVYGFVRLGRAPCYHTWASKVLAVACGLSMIPLLAEWSAVPFHAAMTLLVLCGVEEIMIAVLVPWHEGEVPTVWHAWRMRREKQK